MLKQLCQCQWVCLWLSCALCREIGIPPNTPRNATGWHLLARVVLVLGDGVGHSSCQRRKDCKGQHLSQSRQLNASKGKCMTGTTAYDELRSNRAACQLSIRLRKQKVQAHQASERTSLPVSADCSMAAMPLPAEHRKPQGFNI